MFAVGGGLFAALVREAVFERQFRRDQGLPGFFAEIRVVCQGVDDATVELRRLGHGHEIVVLLAPMAQHHLGALGEQRSEPQGNRGHAGVLQVYGHVGGKLVVTCLLSAVGRAVHVADTAERGGEGDEPGALANHDGRRVVAGDIGRAQADIQNPGKFQRLLPETAGIDQLVVNVSGVVDQYVQPVLLGVDLLKDRPGRGIVGVIALDADTLAASGIDGRHCLAERAAENLALEGRGCLALRASGDVDGHSPARETQGDALAGTAGGAGHQCDGCCHDRSIPKRASQVRDAVKANDSKRILQQNGRYAFQKRKNL